MDAPLISIDLTSIQVRYVILDVSIHKVDHKCGTHDRDWIGRTPVRRRTHCILADVTMNELQ